MIDIKVEYKGRWKDILIRSGVDSKYLTGKHSDCPLNGCGGKDRFRWIRDTETLYCSVCGVRDAIGFLMEWLGLDFKETCEFIRGTKQEYKKMTEQIKPDPMIKLKFVHGGLSKVKPGDPVDTYLKSRGLTTEGLSGIFTHLNLPYYGGWVDGKKVHGVFKAMVSRIASYQLESYHITYLDNDCKQISIAPAKIILTPRNTITGCAVRLFEIKDSLAVAEGIETALAVQNHEGTPCWATISANGMIKLEIPEQIKTLFIYADNDESFTGYSAAYQLAKRAHSQGIKVYVMNDCKPGEDYLDYFVGKEEKSKAAA